MSAQPKLSVVVATYNRREVLRITLAKLASQSIDTEKFEVIVVDDGSTDGTEEMVRSFALESSLNVEYLWHENRGPGFTQNRGIRKARSDLILLIADDIWPTPDFLKEHIRAHSSHPADNIAVLGNVVQSPDLPPTTIHRRWEPFAEEYKKVHDRTRAGNEINSLCFFACNISLKKIFLMRHGLFIERQSVACEDLELGYRLGQKGLRIVFNERALGHHHHETTITQACQREFERGRNLDLLIERIPGAVVFPYCNLLSMNAGLGYFVRTLPRAILRECVFNRWSVNMVWLPILREAEVYRLAALMARSKIYSGVIGYHIRKGFSEFKKGTRNPVR